MACLARATFANASSAAPSQNDNPVDLCPPCVPSVESHWIPTALILGKLLKRMERAKGIEPSTFSLGIRLSP